MRSKDLEGLCGRGLVSTREDVEEGGDEDGEGTEGVERKNDDRRRATRELGVLSRVTEGGRRLRHSTRTALRSRFSLRCKVVHRVTIDDD